MKRYISFILCILLVMTSMVPIMSFATVSEAPELIAETAVLINAKTGEILFDKNKDYQEFPASTTKVMTALLTLENLSLDDTTIVTHNASFTEGSRIFLFEGEEMTIEQLLYAMLLASANDAAIALAEAVAGDVDSFADMMNARAKELGAVNTHFETPNGLPNDEHKTTAYDLALIAKEAMKNETFRKIVSTYEYVIPPTPYQAEARLIHNTNKLLYDTSHIDVNGVQRQYLYDGILGIKTGYTEAAQSCLIAGAERDGVELIGVILHSDVQNQYPDMIKLLDFGFGNFTTVTLVKTGEVVASAKVRKGAQREVELTVETDINATVEATSDGSEAEAKGHSYTTTVRQLTAHFEAGTKAGTLTVYNGSKEAGTYDLVTAEAVDISGLTKVFSGSFISWQQALIIIIVAIVLLYMVFVTRVRRQHKREQAKRKALREERRLKYAQLQKNESEENLMSSYAKDFLAQESEQEKKTDTILQKTDED